MTLDNKNVYLEDVHPDYKHEHKKIGEKMSGDSRFVVRHNGDILVSGEVVDKCLEAMEGAFDLEQKIFGGEVKGTYWQKNKIDLTLTDKMNGAMNNAFGIKTIFALEKSKKTLTAAMIHEMVEMWREDKGLIGEGVPLMVEYLFCNDDRLDLFDGELTKNFGQEGYSHQKGWNRVVRYLGFGGGRGEDLKKGLSDWKNSLTEEEKIIFIKEKLLNWDQNKEENDTGN